MGVTRNPYEEYNFCLDKKLLEYTKEDARAVFVRLSVNGLIRVKDMETDFSFVYDIPFLNNKAEFDIGEKINKFFFIYEGNLLNPRLKDNHILNYCEVRIQASELNKDFSVISTKSIGSFKFYPGKKPRAYPIFTNHLMRRRVAGSKVLLPSVGRVDASWGVLVNTPQRLNGMVYCLSLSETDMSFPKRKSIGKVDVITFPKTRNVINVQWLNQNLVPDWATFTGEYKISHGFSHNIGGSIYKKFKKKYHTETEKVLKINTGFILKKEIPMLDELMQSPLCFVELEDRFLRCIPHGEKIGDEDSTAQLIQSDLEFLIVDEIWK